MGPLGPCVAVFVFGVVVILWVWKNVELWVVMKDVFEVPKIVMSNCGVGIVAGAINVMEKRCTCRSRKGLFLGVLDHRSLACGVSLTRVDLYQLLRFHGHAFLPIVLADRVC